MKGFYKFSIIILISMVLSSLKFGNFELRTCLTVNAAPLEKVTDTNTPITHQQSKAQVDFFHQALDEFGATSPEQVIKIWAKAESSRNGVFHYAVACEELKREIIKKWGDPEENYWIIGGSSPWVDKYEIISFKNISDSVVEAKIKFFWATSYSPVEATETTLTIIKDGDIWCVKEVK